MLQIEPSPKKNIPTSNLALMEERESCPRCGSLVWEQIRRTRLQKLLHPFKGRCYCRACQQEFWRNTRNDADFETSS